ncbi:MAG: HI0074 family nucleotidyltransferase substrate-binding subunit [Myxococcota bacterium]
MSADLTHNLSNIARALGKLKQFAADDPQREVERAGVIQAFEFSFELYWKTFKKIANDRGYQAGSPKTAVQWAFQEGIIEDDQLWLNMLEDRNRSVHSYNEHTAQAIFENICQGYIQAFETCLERLRVL